MIILFGSLKGGSGNSTLATSTAAFLAQNNFRTIIADTNCHHPTSANWATTRANIDGVNKVDHAIMTGNIYEPILKLNKSYDYTVIDCSRENYEEFLWGLLVSDIFVSPLRQSQADTEALRPLTKLITQAKEINHKLKAFVLLSNVLTNWRIRLADEAREILKDLEGIETMKSFIKTRKSYSDSIAMGIGVTEKENDQKSSDEFTNFTKELGLTGNYSN